VKKSLKLTIATVGTLGATVLAGNVATATASPKPPQPLHKPYTCTFGASKRICVNQAPEAICKDAFGKNFNRRCWWFTGSDTQLVFNWKGEVRTS
jgi:hypothetical protein